MQPPRGNDPIPGGSEAEQPDDTSPVRHASPFRNPWWIPPFLGGVPPIEPRKLRLLGMVTLGMLFEQYDLSLLSAAIKHINEGLNIDLAESGYYLGAIRLGGGRQQIDLTEFPNVRDWYVRISERPAVQRGYQVPKYVTDVPMP